MQSQYPPVGFHFKVVFGGPFEEADMRFQTVSGLNAGMSTEGFQEGGENRFSHRLPQPPKYDNLVLKRGMLIGSSLLYWFRAAIDFFEFHPTTIIVILLNPDHKPLAAWQFVNAYPVRWKIDDFDAMKNAVVTETVEFTYQFFRQIEVPHTPDLSHFTNIANNPNITNNLPLT